MARKVTLSLDGTPSDIEIERSPDGRSRVRLNGEWHAVDLAPAGGHGLYSLLIDGRSYEVYAQPRPGGWNVLIGNRVFAVEHTPYRGRAGRPAAPEPDGVWTLRSPMSGAVAETLVAAGDQVRAGQTLLVIESMKMNNELSAARAGTVTAVHVSPGDRVERGTPLVRVE